MAAFAGRIGKYEILAELGRGAMGTVYKARDPVLDRLVALKTMSEGLLLEQGMKERFYREARSAARLQHPNIVTIYELGEVEGTPFIAMELLDGNDLASLLDQRQLRALDDKLRVALQVCRGLDFAHKRGVIHRDVKPGNIQLLPDGTVKILDFGIAWLEGSTMKTKTGLVMGTPTYMAPEQIAGGTVDHRADMWAVGIILYEMLAGRPPYESETIPALIFRIVNQPAPLLDPRALGMPEALVAVVDKALAKRPDGRFRDLAEMGRAIQGVLGAPVSDLEIPVEARERAYTRNLDLAMALLSRDEPARALEAARRAQALEPSRLEIVELVARIEALLRHMAEEPTLATSGPRATGAGAALDQDLESLSHFEVEKRIDEARLALTGGKRTEALRIVEDVLSFDPSFRQALELREILATPRPPGRARADEGRTYTQVELRLKRASSFREQVTFGEPLGIQVMSLSPRENLVAVGGVDGSIRLWDLQTHSKLGMLRSGMHKRAGHEGLVTSLAFSADGAYLASGHVDGAIHLWSLQNGEELKVRLGHDSSVGGLAFSPDRRVLASGGLDATLKLWEMAALQAGEGRRSLHRQPAGVTSLAYAREGAWIVTGHTNRLLRIQDAIRGRLLVTLRGHEAALSFVALSPDGRLLASGAQDRTVRVFDLEARAQLKVLEGHKKTVSSIAFFPDGEQAASVAMDNSVVLWELRAGGPCATLWGAPEESFASVAILAQGQQICCGLSDGRIRLWSAA